MVRTDTAKSRATRRALVGFATGGAVAVLGAALLPSRTGSPPSAHAQGAFAGTYFSLVNVGGNPAGALITFHADGTVTQTGTLPGTGPSHGAWAAQDDSSLLVILRQFRFDDSGGVIGSTKVRFQAQLNADASVYTSRGVAAVLDLDGNVTQTTPLQSRATRVDPEPLP